MTAQTFTIHHTAIKGAAPHWYQLECAETLTKAATRARQYALDNGGYVYVKDASGDIVYGTDPVALDRSIASGLNRHFVGAA